MPMTPDALEADLRAAFPDASIEIQDLAGDGDHYKARIVSAAFAGAAAGAPAPACLCGAEGQDGRGTARPGPGDRRAMTIPEQEGRPVWEPLIIALFLAALLAYDADELLALVQGRAPLTVHGAGRAGAGGGGDDGLGPPDQRLQGRGAGRPGRPTAVTSKPLAFSASRRSNGGWQSRSIPCPSPAPSTAASCSRS